MSMTIKSYLESKSDQYGDKEFLIFQDKSYTFEEINDMSNKFANYLDEYGLDRGEKISIMLPNCPEYIICWFGASKNGIINVNVDVNLKGDMLKRQITTGNPKILVIHQNYLNRYKKSDLSNEIDTLLIVGSNTDSTSDSNSVRKFEDVMQGRSKELNSERNISRGQTDSVIFTSGTTGPAKGCLLPGENFVYYGEESGETIGVQEEDRIFTVTPLYHASNRGNVFTTLSANASIVIMSDFSASNYWEQVIDYDATMIINHWAIHGMLLDQPHRKVETEHNVWSVGPLQGTHAEEFMNRFGINSAWTAYGSSEAGIATNMEVVNDPDSVWTGLYGGYEFESVNVGILNNNDELLSKGETGEIVVRPDKPHRIFKGYFDNPRKTIDAFENLWYHTGDLGKIEDGLHFVGRKSTSIRKKGKWVPMEEVENVLEELPNVSKAILSGIEGEYGEDIKANIVRSGELAPEEVIGYSQENLADHMIPRYVEFLEESAIPTVGGTEKIQRYKLEGVKDAWDRKS